MSKDELNKKFDNFLTMNNNKYVSLLIPGRQCFDLAVKWTDILGVPHASGNPSPFPYPNAYQIYTDFGDFQKKYFERIANTPSAVPQKGDVVVWAGSYNGGIGHVATASGVGDTNTFQAFSQNVPLNSVSRLVTFGYGHVLGWLRPITNSPSGGTGGSVDNRGAVYDQIANGFPDRLKVNGDTHTATVKQGTDFVAWVKDNVDRAGKYDLLIKNPVGISEADKNKYREEGRKQGVKESREKLQNALNSLA